VEKLPEVLDWPDLSSVRSSIPKPIISPQMVETAMVARGHRPLMMMDLGVPRNIAVMLKEIPNIQLSDIDGLTEVVEEKRKLAKRKIPRALALIDDQIDGFMALASGCGRRGSVSAQLRNVPEQSRHQQSCVSI